MQGSFRTLLVCVLLCGTFFGCAHLGIHAGAALSTAPLAAATTVTQVSTINALLQGLYDGVTPCKDLSQWGQIGIGTLDALDGELIILDGALYQAASDGNVYVPKPEVRSPFATVATFRPARTLALGPMDSFGALETALDAQRGNPNIVHVFRIEGTFTYVKVRSVPRQNRPYPPLAEVAKHQPTFAYSGAVRGVLVGFWFPKYLESLNVPGYHLHFLSEDRKHGGHVLDCKLASGSVQIADTDSLRVIFPGGASFENMKLDTDLSQDLYQVEKNPK